MQYKVETKIRFDQVNDGLNVVNKLTETNIKNIEVNINI